MAEKRDNTEKVKRIEDYRQTKPPQLDLFQHIPLKDDAARYSNLMNFYDTIPKYVDHTPKREAGKYLPELEREFMYQAKKYKVRLNPARVQDKDGNGIEYYPGKKEEIIEDALRKIAMKSGSDFMFFDEQAGIRFTLYQLQKELKENKCSASIDEIKHSLKICAKSVMEIEPQDGGKDEFTLIAPLFQTLLLNDRTQYEDGNKWCFARFHPLVTRAIQKKAFRLYDYKKGMALKSTLSSYIFKRLSFNFTQASLWQPYGILLTTLVRDAGLDPDQPLWRNFEKVKKAVAELQKQKVVEEAIYEREKAGRKLVEVKITLTTTHEFSSTIKAANYSKNKILEKGGSWKK